MVVYMLIHCGVLYLELFPSGLIVILIYGGISLFGKLHTALVYARCSVANDDLLYQVWSVNTLLLLILIL